MERRSFPREVCCVRWLQDIIQAQTHTRTHDSMLFAMIDIYNVTFEI